MWAFAIKQKMTAAILLCTVLVAVMITNMRQQRTVQQISANVTSIYEDRLVVAEYILQLSKFMENIIKTLEVDHKSSEINGYLSDISAIINQYDKTILTEIESSKLADFKQLCEMITINTSSSDQSSSIEAARKAENILQNLSTIQVEEGKKQLDDVLSMVYVSKLISYLELGILIVIALLIQMLIFASKTLVQAKKITNERLN